MKFLICGLGNIGPEYEKTRHNIGFMVVDALVDKLGGTFELKKLAYVAEVKYKGKTLVVIKPTTYMNLSGKALNYYMKENKIPIDNTFTITDDIAIPFGKIRIRPKGSNGGHNGLGNIQEILGSDQYPRLRFGVGGDFPKGRQVQYVLGEFDSGDAAELPLFVEKAVNACLSFATVGLSFTMNQFNK